MQSAIWIAVLRMIESHRKPLRKRLPRHKKLRVIAMESDDLPVQLALLLNISERGIHCKAVTPPPMGALLRFQFGAIERARGKIRWVNGNSFGVELVDQVDVLAILFAKTGFRACDYALPLEPRFGNMLALEYSHQNAFG